MSRDLVRWLLRVLTEPSFLRYYVLEPDQPLDQGTFEAELFGLAVDSEHSGTGRDGAWEQLAPRAPIDRRPARWFQAIVRLLREVVTNEDHDLARYWALPELLAEPIGQGDNGACSTGPYHELHCHLRGGVPFDALWQGYLADARQRASLRRYPCLAHPRKVSWAELVDLATEADLAGCGDSALSLKDRIERICDPNAPIEGLLSEVRYVATRAGLRRFLLHQRTPGGLSSFVRSYEQYSKAQRRGTGLSDELHTEELVRHLLRRFEDDGTVAIELRPTLETSRAALQRKLRGVVRGYFKYVRESRHPMVLGIVPSLHKQELALPCRQEPESSQHWRDQQSRWAAQTEVLLATIESDPLLRWFVVGIDAAGEELGCPPSALRPAFAAVHRYNQGSRGSRPGRAMDIVRLKALAEELPDVSEIGQRLDGWASHRIRLGITVHAGEDFEDPLTGLRHIWQTVTQLELGPGDRLGHGLAASLDPGLLRELFQRRYGCERPTLQKSRGTHLLDLAWIAEVGDPVQRAMAQARLSELAGRAFGTPADAGWLLRELGDHSEFPRLGVRSARYYSREKISTVDLEQVVLDSEWRDLFESLRQRVLALLVQRRIFVESCPTSNLVVADLKTPPIYGLLKVQGLQVVLATDDPGLLECYPKSEVGRAPKIEHERLLQTAARASFVWRRGSS